MGARSSTLSRIRFPRCGRDTCVCHGLDLPPEQKMKRIRECIDTYNQLSALIEKYKRSGPSGLQ